MDLTSTSSGIGDIHSTEASGSEPLTSSDSSQCCHPNIKKSWDTLVFHSIKEVEDFYGQYAYKTGFSIRSMLKSKNNSKNKKSDKIHYIRYVCDKEGFKKGSLLNPNNKPRSDSPVVIEFEKVKERPEERIGCKAGIYLMLDEALNVYKIYRWEGNLCHPLHREQHHRYLRSFREVNEVQGQLALINSKAGMSMRTSWVKELEARRISHFAAFLGFDNHRKSVLFGAALLYDETAATFDWLFTTFLKRMSNKKPQTIYTDQATALLKSVPNIFQGVFHGLCSWHISENAKKNLGTHPEASQIFLDGVLEAGKKAEELLFSKGIGTNPSLVTPSKSSKAIVVVGEPSSGKSTTPKFKERPNPIKSKKRLKSDYEKARER
ncbi:unnamed protein product [Trifolium pratense]|uniref:Uncharacterized protein n=1 Tax=Trifolium pratense TaxID=57577 RepID=A0ACB0I8L0_TRIPR|nr:unnamed protein product [Trifolium pratense]